MHFVIAAVFAFLLIGFPAEAKEISTFYVGLWQGGVQTNDADGSFSHCSAGGPVRDDVGLATAINRRGWWSIAFITREWPMETKATVPVRLRFNGGEWLEVEGILVNKGVIEIVMPPKSKFLALFKQALNLEARIGSSKKTYAFPLAGTTNVMNRLVQCVDEQIATEGKTAPKQTESAPSEPAQTTKAEAFATEEASTFNVGDWQGGAYVDKQTKALSHCGVSGPFNADGVSLLVTLTRDLSWSLGFVSQRWSLTPDTILPIQIRFGKGAWIDFEADVITKDHVAVHMFGNVDFAERFMRGSSMEIRFNKKTYAFALTGTYKIMVTLTGCVGDRLAMEGKTPPSQPVAASATPEDGMPADKSKTGPTTYTGTGIIVSTSGHIVTNAHVVEGCSEVAVRQVGDVAQTAKTIVSDRVNDLALIKSSIVLKEDELGHLTAGRSARAGEKVAVYGFPLAGALSSTGNIVEGNITSAAGLGDDINHFQISAPIQPGNSGGPLLDFGGGVIGVVNAKMDDLAVANAIGTLPQNVNFAIKKSVLANFLETHDVPYVERPRGSDLTLVDIAEKAKKFTVLLACTTE
jgi:S1-C subfamily serine protease